MDSEVLSLLCDPDTRYQFELDGSTLRNTATGRVYPIRGDIPLFVSTLTGPNLKSQALYDRIAPVYDLAERLRRLCVLQPDHRIESIQELELRPHARVLEVGVGTGLTFRHLPPDVDFYGIDLSWGMLHKCRENLRRWRRSARLFQAEAGRLPFRAEVFDCVFHFGGINLFSDPARAIREMIWVAKPGTKIVIVDEIRRVLRRNESHSVADMPVQPNGENAVFPVALVPREMEEIEMRRVASGKFYCLTFRKPASLSEG